MLQGMKPLKTKRVHVYINRKKQTQFDSSLKVPLVPLLIGVTFIVYIILILYS